MAAQRAPGDSLPPVRSGIAGAAARSACGIRAASISGNVAAREADVRRVLQPRPSRNNRVARLRPNPVCDPSEPPHKILQHDVRRLGRAARRREHGKLLDVDQTLGMLVTSAPSLTTTIRSDTPMTSSKSDETSRTPMPSVRQPPDHRIDRAARADVDPAGRLIEDQELRGHENPSRQHDLLLHSARERQDAVVQDARRKAELIRGAERSSRARSS